MIYEAGQVVTATAVDVAHGGWCVARPDDGPVLFIRHALPGETVRAQVTDVTSRLARAEAVEILAPSPDRVEPPCPHARPGGCGGCDWQHVTLPAQRSLKAAVIRQQLRRLAGIDREVTVEALPGDGEPGPGLGWRTRVQFAVGPDGVAGLRAHRSHRVIDIGECLIAHPGITDLGIPARRWPGTTSVEALVSPASAERAVIITPGATSPQPSAPDAVPRQHRPADAPAIRPPGPVDHRGPDAVPPSAPPDLPDAEAVRPSPPADLPDADAVRPSPPADLPDADAVRPSPRADLPDADAVFRRTGPSGRRLTPVRGRAYLRQRAAGHDWRVSAGAFWQVHPGAADALAEAVLTALEPQPGDGVLDLYCGVGLFAGVLARAIGPTGTVAGVEADPAAVRDARHNLRPWSWARVHKGDVAAILRRHNRAAPDGFTSRRDTGPDAAAAPRRHGRPEAERRLLPRARLVVADPPRSGLAREVIGYLGADRGATRFAYVSCDPATLARDIGLLIERGWVLAGLRAFDAFPMTHHVECVATLVKGLSALPQVTRVSRPHTASGARAALPPRPRSRPSHAPARAALPPRPRSRPSHAPARVSIHPLTTLTTSATRIRPSQPQRCHIAVVLTTAMPHRCGSGAVGGRGPGLTTVAAGTRVAQLS
jgi:tRNA/tmRNA/rRNA uracil-C5-methylase (TrmA/RlmC/RlmD family)